MYVCTVRLFVCIQEEDEEEDEEVWYKKLVETIKRKRREQYYKIQKAAIEYVRARTLDRQESELKILGYIKPEQTVGQVPTLNHLACVRVCEEKLYNIFKHIKKEYVFQRLVKNEPINVEIANACTCWDYDSVEVSCNCGKRSWEKLDSTYQEIYADEILDWDEEICERIIAVYPYETFKDVKLSDVNYHAEIELVMEEMRIWLQQGKPLQNFHSTTN